MKNILYFAYGSDVDFLQMVERCPESRFLGIGRLPDMELSFAGHSDRWEGGVATAVPKPGAHLDGVLYQLSTFDLARLDSIQGVPDVRTRKLMTLSLWTGDACIAWVYQHLSANPTVPTRSYLEFLQQAYETQGLDTSALAQASRIETSP